MKLAFSLETFWRPADRVWLLLLLSLGIGWTAASRAAEKSAPGLDEYLKRIGYQSIVYTSKEKSKPYVAGKLRKKEYVFVVDTGWSRTTLDKRTAVGLKTLGELGAELDDGTFGTLTNSSIVIMDKLVLGEAQFLNQPAEVEKLRAAHTRIDFQGILGLDFLVRNFGLIDCGTHRFYVRGSKANDEQSKALEETLRRSGFLEVPIYLSTTVTVAALINSQIVRLLVDTGSAYSIVDESQISRLRLNMMHQTSTGGLIPREISALSVGIGAIGAHELRVSPANTLQLSGRKWTKVQLGVSNLQAWGECVGVNAWAGQVQGFLGLDVLANDGALIDLAGSKLWFRPAKGESH